MRKNLKIKSDATEEKALTEKVLARRSGEKILTGRMGTILKHLVWNFWKFLLNFPFAAAMTIE